MKLIVAVDKEWNIGNNGDLLFHIPDDMKFFRSQTINKVVVMGRKTLESFPNSKPLKNRVNIVLTNNKSLSQDGAEFVNDVDSLFERLKSFDNDDVYVIGGEAIYTLLLPYCDTAIITHVNAVADKADKKFPALSDKDWYVESITEGEKYDGLDYAWYVYKRK